MGEIIITIIAACLLFVFLRKQIRGFVKAERISRKDEKIAKRRANAEEIRYIREQEKERIKKDKIRRKVRTDLLEKEYGLKTKRDRIPEEVKETVWRRDVGKCVKCGGRENLEFDHIIPVVKGGSNTARNIELLCERCNRSKKDNI